MKHFVWTFILIFAGTAGFAETHRLALTPENVHWGYFDARIEPVLTILSGDEVLFETHIARGLERLRLAGATDDEFPESMRIVEREE